MLIVVVHNTLITHVHTCTYVATICKEGSYQVIDEVGAERKIHIMKWLKTSKYHYKTTSYIHTSIHM